MRRNGPQELVRSNVVEVYETRSGAYKEKRTGEGDGERCYWLARLKMRRLVIHILEFTVYAYSTDISRFRLLLLSSSPMRMISLAPAPPTASIVCPACLSVRCRKRLTWYMEPSGEAAKNKRSVMSHTVEDMGFGKWKVVSKD